MALVCLCDSDDDADLRDGPPGPFRHVGFPQERPDWNVGPIHSRGSNAVSAVSAVSFDRRNSHDSHSDRVEAMKVASKNAGEELMFPPLSQLAAARLTRNSSMPAARPPQVHKTSALGAAPRCNTMGSARAGYCSSATSFSVPEQSAPSRSHLVQSYSPRDSLLRQTSSSFLVKNQRDLSPNGLVRSPSHSSFMQAPSVLVATTEGSSVRVPPGQAQRQQSFASNSYGIRRSVSCDGGLSTPRQPQRMYSCSSFSSVAPSVVQRSPSFENMHRVPSPFATSVQRSPSFENMHRVPSPFATSGALISPRMSHASFLNQPALLASLAHVARSAVAPDTKARTSVSVAADGRANGSFNVGRTPSAASSGVPPPPSNSSKAFSPFWLSPRGPAAAAASTGASVGIDPWTPRPESGFMSARGTSRQTSGSPLDGILDFTQMKGLGVLAGRGDSMDHEMSEEEEPPPDVPLDVVIKRLSPAPPLVNLQKQVYGKRPLLPPQPVVAQPRQPAPRRAEAGTGKMFWRPPPGAVMVCDSAPNLQARPSFEQGSARHRSKQPWNVYC